MFCFIATVTYTSEATLTTESTATTGTMSCVCVRECFACAEFVYPLYFKSVLTDEYLTPLNGNVTAAVSTDTIPSSVRSEDNYTVMHSAKATAVPVQPVNNDNNTIRYVQDQGRR